MFKVKFLAGVSFLLMNLDVGAHITIAGFEKTLNPRQRRHFELFIQTAKREAYSKCFYSPVYQTVACQNQAGERRLFQLK